MDARRIPAGRYVFTGRNEHWNPRGTFSLRPRSRSSSESLRSSLLSQTELFFFFFCKKKFVYIFSYSMAFENRYLVSSWASFIKNNFTKKVLRYFKVYQITNSRELGRGVNYTSREILGLLLCSVGVGIQKRNFEFKSFTFGNTLFLCHFFHRSKQPSEIGFQPDNKKFSSFRVFCND